ncbi:MAG: hypothetical protein LBL69_05970 [Zoogloeaceae bacterium]|jgi:hypothetical protein|nr:hypothetical protein [Zoogloeaceae bacterium]
MRALVFLLLFANLLFFAYAQGFFGTPPKPDAGRLQTQIHPERIVIATAAPTTAAAPASAPEAATATPMPAPSAPPAPVTTPATPETPAEPAPVTPTPPETPPAPPSAPEAPAAPPAPPPATTATAPATPATAPPEAPAPTAAPSASCLRITGGKPEDQVWLGISARGAGFDVREVARTVWWVHIPEQPDRVGAERKAAELQQLGVKDFFIVHEGEHKNAISLGVFSREAGAKEHLAALRKQKVRSAIIARRESPQTVREIIGDPAKLAAWQKTAKTGDSIKLVACPGGPRVPFSSA